jgi:hypothetical protein
VSAPAISGARHALAPQAAGAAPRQAVSRWLWAGALGALAAGGLHIAVAVDHLVAGELTVGFFLVTAFAQLGLASWLLLTGWTGSVPDRRLVTAAVAGTVALMALYVVAYTTGLLDGFLIEDASGTSGTSAGAHGGATHAPGIDPISGVDLSAGVSDRGSGAVAMAGELGTARAVPRALGSWTIAAETLTVAALAALQPAAWRRRTTNGLLVLGALAWALWLTGVIA